MTTAPGRPLTDQPTGKPTAKLVAGGATGAATLAATWIAEQFGLELDAQTAGALVLLAALLAGYVKKNRATLLQVLDSGDGDGDGGAHYDRDGDGLADR